MAPCFCFLRSGEGIVSSECHIVDYPSYPHRGLLVDAGRRFVPVDLLLNFIDSMSYSKVPPCDCHACCGGCGEGAPTLLSRASLRQPVEGQRSPLPQLGLPTHC